MIGKIVNWVLGNRRALSTGLFISLILAIGALTQLKIDFRFQNLVSSSDETLTTLQRYLETWKADASTFLLIVQSDTVFDSSVDAYIDRLEGMLQAEPTIEATVSYRSMPRIQSSDALLEVSTLRDDDIALKDLRNVQLRTQEIIPVFLSEDRKKTMMSVVMKSDSDDLAEVLPVVNTLREVIETLEKPANLKVHLSGIPALRADVVYEIATNQMLFLGLTMVLMIVMLSWVFRTRQGVLFPILLAAAPVVGLFAVMGFVGEPIGLMSQTYMSLLAVLGIADSIHIVSTFQHLRDMHPDETKEDIIRKTYDEVGMACWLTSLTTAIGFLSLLVADMHILRNFGLYAAIGVFIAFFMQLVLLPLLLTKAKNPIVRPKNVTRMRQIGSMTGSFVMNRVVLSLLIIVILSCALGFSSTKLSIDNRLRDSLGDNHPTNLAHRIIDDELGGTLGLHIYVEGVTTSGTTLISNEVLRACHQAELALKTDPRIRAVLGPARIYSELWKGLTHGREALPRTLNAIAQSELALDDEILSGFIDSQSGALRIVAQMGDMGGEKALALVEELRPKIDKAFEGSGVTWSFTGVPYVAYRGFNKLSGELVLSLLIAALLISCILGFVYRKISWALLALIPNLFPLAAIATMVVLLDWHIDPAGAVLFTLALGIAVDDTIHVFNRVDFHHRNDGTRKTRKILLDAIRDVSPGMITTSAVLIIGFAVNAFSTFRAPQMFGVLGATAIFVALWADLLILPLLLLVSDRFWRQHPSQG